MVLTVGFEDDWWERIPEAGVNRLKAPASMVIILANCCIKMDGG